LTFNYFDGESENLKIPPIYLKIPVEHPFDFLGLAAGRAARTEEDPLEASGEVKAVGVMGDPQ